MSGLKKYYFGRLKAYLLPELVAYYKFDDNLLESTGMSPNGSRSSLLTYASGKIGDSVSFEANVEGNSTYIDISNNSNFSFTDGPGNDLPFSISLWITLEGFSTIGNFLITKRDASTNDEYQVVILSDNSLIFNKFSNGTSSAYQAISVSNAIPEFAQWCHIVYTDDGSKTVSGMNFYINSVLASKNDISFGSYLGMNSGSSFVRLANASWNAIYTTQHRGKIDELAIYKNRCLSQKDVKALFNSNYGKTYPF